jgi:hypothetical protein
MRNLYGTLVLTAALTSCYRPAQYAPSASGFLLAADYGVKCDGSTQNATPLQNAINAAGTTHRALYIEAGTGVCWFNTTLTINANNVIVRGIGRPTLSYTGNGSAITIGQPSSVVYQAELSDLIISLENAGTSAIGITEVATRNSVVSNVEIKTGQGRANSIGQTAVKIDGTGSFSAMNDFNSVYIHGDFTTGYLITGANSFNSTNSTHIISGGVFNTATNKGGSIGIRVQFGDTTRVTHTSVENWGTGIRVESNFNGPFSGRFENNVMDWEVTQGVINTSFTGGVFSEHTDKGTGTAFTSNGSELKTQIGDTLYIPALKSKTGVRSVCIDSTGKLTSQTGACNGT